MAGEVETATYSDGEVDSPFILYKDRDNWKDVTPIPQDDGPNAVVRIAYSEKFQDVYDYFRAVLKADERSERALQLTKDAAELNPANYTVWHYRQILLQALNKDLWEEMQYIQQVIEDNPKNYQVWHHRRLLVEWLKDPSKELQFTESILQMDAKNYHAWSHRQWVLSTYNLWEKELDYVDKLLEDDVRNNSAWNHRYYVVSRSQEFSDDVVEREVRYTLVKIKKAPNNESAWNYLRGILDDRDAYSYPNLMDTCQEMYDSNIRSSYLLGFIIDMYEEMLEANTKDQTVLTKAVDMCKLLSEEVDLIRREYWTYRSRTLAIKFGAPQDN